MVHPQHGRPIPPPRPPPGRPAPPAPPRAPPPPPHKLPPRPTPPQTKPPPPPPPPKSTAKRTVDSDEQSHRSPKRARLGSVSIQAPVLLRDVNAFNRKHQVGQGTYGSVFVGQDKISKEIFALKRINTEQEENGFPITALREVKILKALHHENIVKLKEIVTSKGKFAFVWTRVADYQFRACLFSISPRDSVQFFPPRVKASSITKGTFSKCPFRIQLSDSDCEFTSNHAFTPKRSFRKNLRYTTSSNVRFRTRRDPEECVHGV